jgi:glycosyltransferase involved in cell wall biosynthesis
MRLLVLTADYPPNTWSGIGVAVKNQAQALAGSGLNVCVLYAPGSPVQEASSSPRLVVHPLNQIGFPVNPRQFDLLHLHSLALSELALEIKRRYGLPVVYTAHSLLDQELEESLEKPWWSSVQEAILQVSDHVIFLNSQERARAIARWEYLSEKSSVIPNPLPPPEPGTRPSLTRGPVVFAGRFTRQKGIALLVEIVQRLSARTDYDFVLAGGHADEYGEQQIQRLQHEFPDRCHLAGWLEPAALDRLFSRAGLVLAPSYYEPFGMVALEAMRMGAPVLGAAVGGLLENIKPDSGGRLVWSHDPEEWCAGIVELMEDRAANLQLRRQGPLFVQNHYHPEKFTARIVHEVYSGARSSAGGSERCL